MIGRQSDGNRGFVFIHKKRITLRVGMRFTLGNRSLLFVEEIHRLLQLFARDDRDDHNEDERRHDSNHHERDRLPQVVSGLSGECRGEIL